MQVSDILEQKDSRIVSADKDASFATLAELLRQEAVGAIMIFAADRGLAGIVSERDLVRAVASHGAEAIHLPAGELMSSSVVTCGPSSSTSDIMEQMLENHIRHLPVIEGDDVIGMISVNDVIKAVHGELKWMAKALRDQVVLQAGWATDEH
jgi:signal-transduction protein with cAMP-binding, CBS, and nucleotidyltransferase domain